MYKTKRVQMNVNSENCGESGKKRWSAFSSQLISTALQGSLILFCYLVPKDALHNISKYGTQTSMKVNSSVLTLACDLSRRRIAHDFYWLKSSKVNK